MADLTSSKEQDQSSNPSFKEIGSFNFIDEDLNQPKRKRRVSNMQFSQLPKTLADFTMVLLERQSRAAGNKFKTSIDKDELACYYGRILVKRISTSLQAAPMASTSESEMHIINARVIPSGISPKFIPMIDLFQVILGHIGVCNVIEPAFIVRPNVLKDEVLSYIEGCSDDAFRLISDELSIASEVFGARFPISKGVPHDPDGEDEFMKICVINNIMSSISKDLNPSIFSLAILSGHIIDSESFFAYNYDCGNYEETLDTVLSSALGRT
jgi:hypothetical protein